MSKEIIFLSWYDSDYSRSAVKFNGMKEIGINSRYLKIPTGMVRSFSALLRQSKLLRSRESIVVVASPSHLLVLFCRLIGVSRVFLDAGWPLLDSTRIRCQNETLIRRLISQSKSFVIDLISFKFAHKVFLESFCQSTRATKRSFTRKNKFEISYTGFNESVFRQINNIDTFDEEVTYGKGNYAFFRGKSNFEADLNFILECFSKTSTKCFLVIATDSIPQNISIPPNTKIIQGFISNSKLSELYENCLFTVGQFGNLKRLRYTIPHKVFESAYYGKPYLTPLHAPLLEVLPRNAALYISELSQTEIVRKLEWCFNNREYLEEIGENARKIYDIKYSQEKITLDFIRKINDVKEKL